MHQSNNEIFHQTKIINNENAIISRAAVFFNTPTKILSSNFTHYDDNINDVIEKLYLSGQITNKERYNKILQIWDTAASNVATDMIKNLETNLKFCLPQKSHFLWKFEVDLYRLFL